jgi:hypothetical protein
MVSGHGANIANTAGAHAANTQDVARDWEAIRHSAEIQFAPLPPIKPPETPAWLEAFQRFLEAVFGPLATWLVRGGPLIEKLMIAAAVLLVLYLLWRLLGPLVTRLRDPKGEAASWAPSRDEALALLGDADRLAGEGHYGEAAHLLLQRSVGQIRAARPNALIPASTAREIALLPQLPQAARDAFGVIANRVERSLFALRDLDAGDWTVARAAYADFALARLRE